jgi:hypothetical protein
MVKSKESILNFKNANEAFEMAYPYINAYGRFMAGTKAIYNSSFTILNPMDNIITNSKRKLKYHNK